MNTLNSPRLNANVKPIPAAPVKKPKRYVGTRRSVIDLWAGGFLLVGLVFVSAHGFGISTENAVSKPAIHFAGLSTALLWSIACLGIGGLLGFLFGIPRNAAININQPGVAAVNAAVGEVTTSDHPAGPAGKPAAEADADPPDLAADSLKAEAPLHIATVTPAHPVPALPTDKPGDSQTTHGSSQSNLEQVSDWITKLLLGGSLTQLAKIPQAFMDWGYYVASGIDPANASSHQSFASGLIIYFLVLGFVAGYVITKVELGSALVDQS